jgi:hypothetical protein
MTPQTATVVAASIAAAIAVMGWIVTHWLTNAREKQKHRLEASLKFTERQIEELYGPLAILLLEGRQSFEDLLAFLGRKSVFVGHEPLSDEDRKTWLFWVENELLPRNEKIRDLLLGKIHLIEGAAVPKSFLTFLDHHNSWTVNHKRWKSEGVIYPLRSKINFPDDFMPDVLDTAWKLKARHSEYVRQQGIQ